LSTKARIDKRTSLEDLAGLVCTTLEVHGISVVLSGGAVVSIYSDAEYVSHDLDFIPIGLARKVDATMQSLGFEKTQRHWTHPKSRYRVEFPPGPVAIGEERFREFERRLEGRAVATTSRSSRAPYEWLVTRPGTDGTPARRRISEGAHPAQRLKALRKFEASSKPSRRPISSTGMRVFSRYSTATDKRVSSTSC
jgi:hypothetical protein